MQANPPSATTAAPVPKVATERLIRLPEVLATVSFGRTAWLGLVKAGEAPQPVKIGRATFWQASELQSWIVDRIRAARESAT